MTEFRRPCLLDARVHDRTAFACEEPGLTEWLHKYAGPNRRGHTATTWVIADVDDRVVAYATLSMSAVDRSAAPSRLGKSAPDPVPALLVGRLAVDSRQSGLGLGTEMLKHVLVTAVELSLKAAFRAVVVVALNPAARAWWERFGFTAFDPEDPTSMDMYLLTADIEATIASLG